MAIATYRKTGVDQANLELKIEPVFGWGHVIHTENLSDGRSNIILEGLGTAELISYVSNEPFQIGKIQKINQEKGNKANPNYLALLEELLMLTKRILLAQGADEQLVLKMNHITNHPFPIDFIASILNYDFDSKQDILATVNQLEKGNKILDIARRINLRE